MNKLLIIGHQYPEPSSSAAGSRMLQLIRLFQESNYEVCFATEAQQSAFAVDLDAIHVSTYALKLNDSTFDDWVKELSPSVVLFDRFMMEEQFGWRVEKACPAALRILDTEDLHFLRKARGEAVKNGRNLSERDLMSDQAKREIAAILRSDLSIMISQFEMDLLIERFNVPSAHLIYLPFLVDFEAIELPTPKADRQHFISIGNFLHEPNWDATLRLKKVIWPIIHEALPAAELHVYGAYAGDKVNQLHHEKSGFLVKGRAEDALEVISSAKVLLAPLRFGAGIKGKLFEAMLCSTPSGTTSIGAEGMCEDEIWNGFIENDEIEFAKKAIELYRSERMWQNASSVCRDLLNQFDKRDFESIFVDCLRNLQGDLENHRMKNFTGSMLLYHTQRSTEFMSRWIEEKNRSKHSE